MTANTSARSGNLKVATIVGTRPEIIRLSRVISVLRTEFDHTLIHTGQNYDYELNEVFFEDLGLDAPDYFLNAAGSGPLQTIGSVIVEAGRVLEQVRPNAVLVLGDTNSCMAAISAKRLRIPVFHMEAGNRCFDQRVPEELNRRIIDHVSDVNLPYSALARANLIGEGLPADRIVTTGSPMREVLYHYMALIEQSRILERLELTEGRYFLLSCHREENVDDASRLALLSEVIHAVADAYGQPIIFPAHPRTQQRLQAEGLSLPPEVKLLAPLGFLDYVRLQRSARTVLSDSGTITEEAAILGLQAINIRDTHERPEGMEEAAVIMTGLSSTRVIQAIRLTESAARREGSKSVAVHDYATDRVSEKVARIILSYTDYVRRTVWRET